MKGYSTFRKSLEVELNNQKHFDVIPRTLVREVVIFIYRDSVEKADLK